MAKITKRSQINYRIGNKNIQNSRHRNKDNKNSLWNSLIRL